MKVHTDLKELLMDFGLKASKYTNNLKDRRNPEQFVDDYLSINSLASVEPEPLAKNKDSESICEKCNDHVDFLYDGLCYDCYDDEHGM